MDSFKNYLVDVDFRVNENTSEVQFTIRSSDGGPLTGQDLIDAVSECVLFEFGHIPVRDPQDLDS